LTGRRRWPRLGSRFDSLVNGLTRPRRMGGRRLQRLLSDIRDRRIDIVVVYKVNRLTRSLADFAKLVELFDQHFISFVSVT
jgi:DNA invertase Pin-like site-specific DNA recombinase